MRRSLIISFALVASALPAFAGAWPVTHKWSDKARPGDPTSGSFAYEYESASIAIAGSILVAGERWDCSKFAMSVLARYAHENGLEVIFTCPDPENHWQMTPVSSTDARFHSFDDFVEFYKTRVNAKMLAELNTYPVSYDEWRSGDLVLMSWLQLGDQDPFTDDDGNPQDIWHTYFTGVPGKLLFYGNEIGADNAPAPITASSEQFRLDEAEGKGATGPAVYQGSPRRWNIFQDAVIPPDQALTKVPTPFKPAQATVRVANLNVRGLPTTQGTALSQVHAGDKLSVEGETQDGWWRVRLADESVAYVNGRYVTVASVAPAYSIVGGDGPDHRFDTTSGLTGAVDHTNNGP
jgi:hypothetical protein